MAPIGPDYIFVTGYGAMVKNAREKLNLKQEDFAKSINEHKSLVHQVESEHIKPNIVLAKKLERVLHIKIVEEIKPGTQGLELNSDSKNKTETGPNGRGVQKQKSDGLTLGDLINIKNRK
jgi:uncharacterized protein (TIGR00270 family)